MPRITITHRTEGSGYTLVIQGVHESIPMSAEDLLFLVHWGMQHKAELEQESKEEAEQDARRWVGDE